MMEKKLIEIIDILINSSILATLISFFIYLTKKKRERLTEERKDILQDVRELILGIEKIAYKDKETLLELMDAVQFLFGTRNKLNYESLDKEYVFGGLDKMLSACSEEEYKTHKEVVVSFLYYIYENKKESFEKEKDFKKREIFLGGGVSLLFTVIFMIIFGIMFSIKSIYVLLGYGFYFFLFRASFIMLGYCLVEEACDKKRRVVDDKKSKRVFSFLLSIVPILLLFFTDNLMVVFCALKSGQGNESYFVIKLLLCIVCIIMYWMINVWNLCSIYGYNVKYIVGFETVTSRIFYERGYDTDQLRTLAKKIVGDSKDESVYVKLFAGICDKHMRALYSEKRKLEKVMSSFEDAEKLERVIVCIEETKKLKKELNVLRKLFGKYRKKYQKIAVKLEERKRVFLELIEKCNVE